MNPLLPIPDFYGIKDPGALRWAEALVQTLERQQTMKVIGQPLDISKLPAPDGDGYFAWAINATGGAVPIYSRGGQWLRFSNDEVVS